MLKHVLFAVVISLMTTGFAHPRVMYRRSMVCGTVLNAVLDSYKLEDDQQPVTVTPGDLVLLNARYTGLDNIKNFANALEVTRTELKLESEYARNKVSFGKDYFKRLARFLGYRVRYTSGVMFVGLGAFSLGLSIAELPILLSHPRLPEMLTVNTYLALSGLYDYPFRYALSFNFSLPKLTANLRDLISGKKQSVIFRKDFVVSQELATKIRRRQRLAWNDLHAENVRDETPGAWRAWKYRNDYGADPYRLTLRVTANRFNETLLVRLTAKPLRASRWLR